MKASVICRIICWSVAAVVLTGVLVVGISGGFGSLNGLNIKVIPSYDDRDYTIGDGEIAAKGIGKLDIDWTAGSVKILPYDGSAISVSEDSGLSEDNRLRYMIDGDTLKIKYSKSSAWFFSFFNHVPSKNLTVKIPQSLAQSLDELSLNVTSADVSVSSLGAVKVDIDDVSGTVTLDNIKAKEVDIDSVSGEISLSGCDIGSLDSETTSGEFSAEGKFTSIDADTVSGKVKIDSGVCPNTIDAKTVSGEVQIALPDSDGFTVDFGSVSGRMNCAFATTNSGKKSVYGDGNASFKVETVSGDLTITKR